MPDCFSEVVTPAVIRTILLIFQLSVLIFLSKCCATKRRISKELRKKCKFVCLLKLLLCKYIHIWMWPDCRINGNVIYFLLMYPMSVHSFLSVSWINWTVTHNSLCGWGWVSISSSVSDHGTSWQNTRSSNLFSLFSLLSWISQQLVNTAEDNFK